MTSATYDTFKTMMVWRNGLAEERRVDYYEVDPDGRQRPIPVLFDNEECLWIVWDTRPTIIKTRI